jgi:hypothetical protein
MTNKVSKSANSTSGLLAWSCMVLFTGLTVTGLILQILGGSSEGGYGHGEFIILSVSLGGMLLMFSYGYAVYSLLHNPGVLPGGLLMAMLYRGTFFLASLPFILIFLLFPDGNPLTPSWRIVGWVGVVTSCILFLGGIFQTDLLGDSLVINPTNVALLDQLEPLFVIAFVLNFLALVAAAISLLVRLARSEGEQKQQIKWFVYATLFLPIGFGLQFFGSSDVMNVVGFIFAAAAVFGMSLSVGIAIFRYHLWDIDIIIRRLLQQAFHALTGQDSPVAIVISTLVIAALFNPLRGQIQESIDRRFYRGKFDAQQALADFAATARDEVELDQLTYELLSLVQETLQPEQTTLWLVATPTTTNIKSKEMKRSLT